MSFLGKIVKCPICQCDISKFSITPHIKKQHKTLYLEYQKSKYRECEICHSKTLNNRFCSRKCSNVNAGKKLRLTKQERKIKIEQIKNQFNSLTEKQKSQIVNNYKNEIISKSNLAIKFTIDYEVINLIFKEKNIQSKKHLNCLIKNEIRNKKINEFADSNIGKQIIKKYQKEGNNLRNLEKEFNCSRGILREILQLKNIPIKTSLEARNETIKVKHLYGKNHWRYGKVSDGSGHVHWYFYKGNKFQGSWEFKFALWLESQGKTFKCHKDIQKFEYELDGIQQYLFT